MRLLIIRHARAAAAAHGSNDEARPLTDEGRHEFQLLAREIAEREAIPEFIIHSPARRTTETASILATEVGVNADANISAPWLGLDTHWDRIAPRLAELAVSVVRRAGL